MKKVLIIFGVIILLMLAMFFWPKVGQAPSDGSGLITCTMEAKLCPDGSYVGRTGPKCEFAKCPDPTISDVNPAGESYGLVTGVVTLSPTCPVERVPPDPACAPKPYQTTVRVFLVDGSELVKTIQTKSDGSFSASIPYGEYFVEAGDGRVYPRCGSVRLSVSNSSPKSVNISCDTGIR